MKKILLLSILMANPFSCTSEDSEVDALHSDEDGRNKGMIDIGIYVDARKTTTKGEIATTQYSRNRWTGDEFIERTSSGYNVSKHLKLSTNGNFYFKTKSASKLLLKLPQKIEIIKGQEIFDGCNEIGYETVNVNNKVVCTAMDEVVSPPFHLKNASIFVVPVKPVNGEIRVRLTWNQTSSKESVVFDISVVNLLPASKKSNSEPTNPNSYNSGKVSTGLFLNHTKRAEVRQGMENGKPANLMSGNFYDEFKFTYGMQKSSKLYMDLWLVKTLNQIYEDLRQKGVVGINHLGT
ncbi:hypothetical protein MEO40_12380 [Dolichospermum sp. ST_sed1]|nr:hypothetical protein [Dolichospermum sp. ST_sed1]